MIVELPCGHVVDDFYYDTTCYGEEGHWPLFTSPETFCKKHDLYRPCRACGEEIGPPKAMRGDEW